MLAANVQQLDDQIGGSTDVQRDPLRYASHQLNQPIGMVAASAHQSGSARSATRPSTVNVIQNILRSISPF
jgi:hypothetical protein